MTIASDRLEAIREQVQHHLDNNEKAALEPERAAELVDKIKADLLAQNAVIVAHYYAAPEIQALAEETHKFESRYLDQLIGPFPERKDLYDARSPLNHLDGFTAPLLLLQGLDDPIVPPNQSEMIYEALKTKGVPTAYVAFEGESHGFRKAENQIASREAELYFYARVLGLEPADELPGIAIDNLATESGSTADPG